MSLKNSLICLAFLSASLSGCQSFEIRDYELSYKYHPKVGGGVSFGVLSHKFIERDEAYMREMLKTAVIMPSGTWRMVSEDLVKACQMLGKKCKQEMTVLNSIFKNLNEINSQLEKE